MDYKNKKRLHLALRRFYGTKWPSAQIAQIIGIDREGFKRHIHNCLLSGMTENTFGKTWGLDHIVPAELFNDEEVSLAYNYNNIIPMFTHDNRLKGASAHFSLAKLETMYTNVFIEQLKERCRAHIAEVYDKYL